MGATLVVVAAVLSFVGYLTATAKPTQRYYVATRDIRAMEPVARGDFKEVDGELPAEVGALRPAKDLDLSGVVATTNLAKDDLVLRSSVARRDVTSTSPYELRFTAPAVKADNLRPRDVITLVGADDTGRNGGPVSVAGLQIIAADPSPSSGGDRVLTVAANDQSQYEAIVKVIKGEFWIVRVNASASRGGVSAGTPSAGPSSVPSLGAPTSTLPPPSLPATPTSSAAPGATRRP